jgi:hypothetical protein
MVVDPSEARSMEEGDEEKPSSWRGKLKYWFHRYLPVKY